MTTRQLPPHLFSRAAGRAWQERQEKQRHIMSTGPHLDLDGHTLIVPSEWYNQIAATFWRQHGFYWNNGTSTWERDTRLPLQKTDKRYTPKAWLQSTRQKYFEFWPTLLYECRHCRKRFARTNQYQTLCPICRDQAPPSPYPT